MYLLRKVCKLVLTGRSWNVQGNRRVPKEHYRPGQENHSDPGSGYLRTVQRNSGQILSAINAIGFYDVVEVALVAEDTSRNEAAEFLERMEGNLS